MMYFDNTQHFVTLPSTHFFLPLLSFIFYRSVNLPHVTENVASLTLQIWLISVNMISQILLIFLNMG